MSQRNSIDNSTESSFSSGNSLGKVFLVSSSRIEEFLTDNEIDCVHIKRDGIAHELFTADPSMAEGLKALMTSGFSFLFDPFGVSPQERLVSALTKLPGTVAVAESCTGGLVGEMITRVPGSSVCFWGGFLTYANEAKERLLGVARETLESYGAVSGETVSEMARGVLSACGTDFALAVSGIAGPGGGTPEKPVGTVWLGIGSSKGDIHTKKLFLSGDRQEIRSKAAAAALLLAESYLLSGNLDTSINWQYT